MDTSPVADLDAHLRQRAAKVIPGGMYGHLNARALPDGYPQFFAEGRGCRVTDVNGRAYIDFMCSWGPVILGHRHPAVEAAVRDQLARGDCLNGPTEHFVALAERLVGLLPHADWAAFAKNGTDATTTAVTVARAGTRRRKVLVARGAYHGAVPWCSPSVAGVTTEDRAHLVYFDYNDAASLQDAARQAGDDMAAIIVSAFKHDMGIALALPTREFAQTARSLCDKADAALILDEVRAGFRLSMHGSWDCLGVKPDLAAWSKAIANGYPLAVLTGNDRFREAFTEIYVTGSFWMGAAAMAAARVTLDTLEHGDGPAHMRAMGERLRAGIDTLAARHGVRLSQSGPAQMPLILFEDDATFAKGRRFCSEMLARGVYMHPRHNMFLSTAHQAADIDEALAAADQALATLSRSGG